MSEKIICCDCGKETTRHYLMCDEVDGEWCPECFDKTDCGKGEHGEGCPTQAFGEAPALSAQETEEG